MANNSATGGEPAAERFRLELAALPGPIPAEVRLRKLLKALRRVYGFTCQQVQTLPAPPSGKGGRRE